MSTSTTSTARLYDEGPTEHDLTDPASPWCLRPELVAGYITAAGQIGRTEWTAVDTILRKPSTVIGLRDSACDSVGQPISTIRIGRLDGSAVLERTIDARTFDDPFAAWPDGITPAGWCMHLMVLVPAARRVHADHEATLRGVDMVRDLCTCSVCGESDPTLETGIVEENGNQYRLCMPCLTAHGLLLQERAAAQRVGKRSRREAVAAWLEGRA